MREGNILKKCGNIFRRFGVYASMANSVIVRVSFTLLLFVTTTLAQNGSDGLSDAAKKWLKDISNGSRTELNASMDERFIATTPAGDVLTKERLVPLDPSQPVQQLPSMELEAPLSRVYGETGIVMGRLKPADGPPLNGTFVFVKQQSGWKLVALHLSPAGR